MQIVYNSPYGISEYVANYAELTMELPESCPNCKCRKWHRWGKYQRYIYDEETGSQLLAIRRIRCTKCGRTQSYLPDFCMSGKTYSMKFVLSFLRLLLRCGKLYKEDMKRQIYRYKRRFKRKLAQLVMFLRGLGIMKFAEEPENRAAEVIEALSELHSARTLAERFQRDTGQHFLTG